MAANIVTAFRIIFSIGIIHCVPFSQSFYLLYTAAGLTDMIDGTIARRMHTESEFGARFDTAADFIFCLVCFIIILPKLQLSWGIYIWIVIILMIKTYGCLKQKRFIAIHNRWNKAVGLFLFLLPYTINIMNIQYASIALCTLATIAALKEQREIANY